MPNAEKLAPTGGAGSGPSPPARLHAALAAGESLALSNLLYRLCVINHISPPWLPYRGTSQNAFPPRSAATSNGQPGNTFSSQKRCFPPQLKSTFMVAGEAMRLLSSFQRKPEPAHSFSGFLLYWKEKRQKMGGGPGRGAGGPGGRGRRRAPRTPSCSLQMIQTVTFNLGRDQGVRQISRYWTNLRD